MREPILTSCDWVPCVQVFLVVVFRGHSAATALLECVCHCPQLSLVLRYVSKEEQPFSSEPTEAVDTERFFFATPCKPSVVYRFTL